jgi:3-(3-hydroxy-phenyl)propionate hydroxylase
LILPGGAPAIPALHGLLALTDPEQIAAARYAADHGTCYLIRPDQHVTARWRGCDAERVRSAARRALEGAPTPAMAPAGK